MNLISTISDAGLNTLILAVIGLITALTAYFTAKTKSATEAIHTAVNSEHTALLKEIQILRDQILSLATAKATLEEKGRGQATVAAVIEAVGASKSVETKDTL
jgi:hypothetical protein